jgi:hypothetical protein
MDYERIFFELIPIYRNNERKICGRCKVEILKNELKLHIWLQNLDQNTYDILIFNFCGTIGVNFSQIVVNNSNYGEHIYTMRGSDIGYIKSLDKTFISVLICKHGKIILAGLNNFDVEALSKHLGKGAKLYKISEIIDIDDSDKDKKLNVENCLNYILENKNQIEVEDEVNYFNNIIKNLEYTPNDFDILAQTRNNITNKDDFIEFLFENNTRMNPFLEKDKNMKYIRCSLKEIQLLLEPFSDFSNYPFVFVNYQKNRHMLLGKNILDKKILIGLPSMYEKIYTEMAMSLGFTKFIACNKNIPDENDAGYWIIDI